MEGWRRRWWIEWMDWMDWMRERGIGELWSVEGEMSGEQVREVREK
jgi:hypothetical protein